MNLCCHWEAEWHWSNQGTTGKGGHDRPWPEAAAKKVLMSDGRLFVVLWRGGVSLSDSLKDAVSPKTDDHSDHLFLSCSWWSPHKLKDTLPNVACIPPSHRIVSHITRAHP